MQKLFFSFLKVMNRQSNGICSYYYVTSYNATGICSIYTKELYMLGSN